jgi:hypothetical protein
MARATLAYAAMLSAGSDIVTAIFIPVLVPLLR